MKTDTKRLSAVQDAPEQTTSTYRISSAVRRWAAKNGLRLWKVRQNSKWFWQYGPFSTVDLRTGGIVHAGRTAQDLKALASPQA